MSQIGLTVGSGQTFSFVGSLINDSAYRSDETFGRSVTTPGNPIYAPNAGFTGSQVFTGDFSYTLGAVPEPGPPPSSVWVWLISAGSGAGQSGSQSHRY